MGMYSICATFETYSDAISVTSGRRQVRALAFGGADHGRNGTWQLCFGGQIGRCRRTKGARGSRGAKQINRGAAKPDGKPLLSVFTTGCQMLEKLEASTGIEPVYTDLQSAA
jgi:hypothetical protein